MISRIFIVLFVVFAFTSCSSDDGFIDDLNKNRQLWESSQIKNYSWNERLSCFCGGILERDIFVVNNVKDRVEYDESVLSPEADLEEIYEYVFNNSNTVDEAFEFIENLFIQDVASLSIEYDEVYGFPTIISIDYIKDAVDDEIAYLYTNFEITN